MCHRRSAASGRAPEPQVEILEALSRQAVKLLELRRVSTDLADALSRVKLLAPLVPVCAWCGMLRNDDDYWTDVGEYLQRHAGVTASHGICPPCVEKVEARSPV